LKAEGKSVDELFEQIDTKLVDLATGEFTEAVDVVNFDQRKAANDPKLSINLDKNQDLAQIGRRSKYAHVYLVKPTAQNGTISKIIMPIKGYGLWGTLYGFLALEGDAETVSGITFYEHKETPGLGGEIENKQWQASWAGKKLNDASGRPRLRAIKGLVSENTPDSQHKIDGLAGATLTSNGVSNLIKFWMGSDGFGPYLQRVRMTKTQASVTSDNIQRSKRG
jgi:Na+-transporting NADH:ubiquinone oxidoreductase subunit C